MPLDRRLKSALKVGARRFGVEVSLYRRERFVQPIDQRPRKPVPDNARADPRIVLLHHQAATGGTLFSAMLASHPRIRLLSEVHPDYIAPGGFCPSTPLDQYQRRYGALPASLAGAAFRDQIAHAARAARLEGCVLIVRDHAHRDTMMRPDRPVVPVLRDALRAITERSFLTVRHPLDSYLSARGTWLAGIAGLETYACRYSAFLDRYPDTTFYRYEDLLRDPAEMFARITSGLGLPPHRYDPSKVRTRSFSGDSGRSGGPVAARRRRRIPPTVRRQMAGAGYRRLCGRLGYDPE